MNGEFKKFKELKPGDKIYTFTKDEIKEYTVTEEPKVEEFRFGYYEDNDIRRAYTIKTDGCELSLDNNSEHAALNLISDSEAKLKVVATSLEEIEKYLQKIYDNEVQSKKEAIENADKRIKLAADQLENFRLVRDKEELLKRNDKDDE